MVRLENSETVEFKVASMCENFKPNILFDGDSLQMHCRHLIL
jgi:hypothetical protein